MGLPGGEGWILRPVSRGWCRYESLLDCTLSLADLALMNDAIDCQEENEQRFKEANT